jgi:ATP-dependent Zn protease
MDKKYMQILEMVENASPCVLLITQLSDLYKHSPVKCLQLIESLSKLERSREKVIAFVTTEPSKEVTELFARYHACNAILTFDVPKQKEREAFFKKSLVKILADQSQFDIPALARETAGQSYSQIQAILRAVQARAFAQHEAVTSTLVTRIIDELVHGLGASEQPNADLAKLYASHWAGKALAHELIKPGSQLMRVTILPSTKEPKQTGAFIFYIPNGYESFFSSGTMKNLCTIELAGNAAAELLGDVTYAGIDSTSYKKAYEFALKSVMNGFSDKHFSKKQQQQNREKAMAIVEDCMRDAKALLAPYQQELQLLTAQLQKEYILPVDSIKQLLIKNQE